MIPEYSVKAAETLGRKKSEGNYQLLDSVLPFSERMKRALERLDAATEKMLNSYPPQEVTTRRTAPVKS